jgi:alpha-glucosidase (family GH31 glycosyl hydrolase)
MPDATIFDDPTRRYCYLSRVQRYRRVPGGARFAVVTNDGEAMALDVRFVGPQAVRVRCRRVADGRLAVDATEHPAKVSVEAREGRIVMRSRALELRVVRRPFHYGVFDFGGRKLLVQQIGDVTPTRLVSLPLGYSRDSGGRVAFHESFELEPEERVQRPAATGATVPAYLSSRGYGVFLNHARAAFELGVPSPITVSFRVDDPCLDYVVVFGKDGDEITARYAEIGRRRRPLPD